MAVRGVFSMGIKKMLEDTNKKMDQTVGWIRPSNVRLIADTKEMQNYAYGVDPWNPLFWNENYAAGTRWGGIIGYPFYLVLNALRSVQVRAQENHECGFDYNIAPGGDIDFYTPIRPDDTFRVWARRPSIKDVTPNDGNGYHTFCCNESDYDLINQKDELVSTVKTYVYRVFYPDGQPPKPVNEMPEYGFTKEEMEYLDLKIRAEKVRGAKIRYWEDVEVGDITDPFVLGPTNWQDCAEQGQIGSFTQNLDLRGPPRSRYLFQRAANGSIDGYELCQDPENKLYYKRGGDAARHWSDHAARAEGETAAFLFFMHSVRSTMLRGMVNWMGDDAFIRKYYWRHIMRTFVGDAAVGWGKVVNKRKENSEYLVDLFAWLRNMRGNITDTAYVTIGLMSKNDPIPNIKRIPNYK